MGKAGRPASGKRARKGGAEREAFSVYARHWTNWRPGSRHWIKKRVARRERSEAKQELRREEQ